jgi:hypothetical protein
MELFWGNFPGKEGCILCGKTLDGGIYLKEKEISLEGGGNQISLHCIKKIIY